MSVQVRTVEVDWQVWQVIEAERRGFDEPRNVALRRLLGIDPPELGPAGAPDSPQAHYGIGASGRSWNWKGVTLPEGTELRVAYSEVQADGRVTEGLLNFDGEGFKTPSQAVMAVVARRRRTSSAPSINGWQYLHVSLPGETGFKPLLRLREKSKLGSQ